MPEGIAVPTAALKPDGAVWLVACRLRSFQTSFCCVADRASVSPAVAAPPAPFDIWLAADAAETPDSSSAAATATEADFFMEVSWRNRRPSPSNRGAATMFH